MKIKFIFSITLLYFLSISCGSDFNIGDHGVDEIYIEAIRLFEDEDYLESKKLFDIIKLQYPASQYADKSQFYLAEIDFKKERFILAAFNYNMLRKVYPTSIYSKESLFKRAMCYYELSPKFDRDQDYTHKAIESFQEFQYNYPDDSLSVKSNNFIDELREKLAQGDYSRASLYNKLNLPSAAIVYYNEVINKYNDTKYNELAYFGKINSLYQLGRFDEAFTITDLYLTKFPNGQFKERLSILKNTTVIEDN